MREKHSLGSSKINKSLVLVIDAGTTNLKIFLVDRELNVIDKAVFKIRKKILRKNQVEQNPEEIFKVAVKLLKKVFKKNKKWASNIIGLGITNQRETAVAWDRKTGKSIYPAIVWEDERTKEFLRSLKKKISAAEVKSRTGLDPTPYFSASKMSWILENVPKAASLLREKRLAFGTIDSWMIFKLTGGKNHFTDYTNASRTLLFNIKTLKWDGKLLSLFNIVKGALPKVKKSFSFFGEINKNILGRRLPILAVLGDQQASLYAAGSKNGTFKITYGTGAFVLQNIGKKFQIRKKLFTTLAAGLRNRVVYALEGKVSSCGARVAPVLRNARKKRKIISQIAKDVNKVLRLFPKKYNKIVIDGGVSQAREMAIEQSKTSKVKVVRQKCFEGTALGVAKLVFDNLN